MGKWTRAFYTPNLPLGEDGKRVTACKEHIQLAKQAAKEGMVLLKNEGQLLPLRSGTKVALFGKASFDYVRGGGGSGEVTVSYQRNLYEGLSLQKEQVILFEELSDFYRKNVEEQYSLGRAPGMTIEPKIPDALLCKAKEFTDTAIVTVSRFSGEGWDRKSVVNTENKNIVEGEQAMAEQSAEIFENGDFYLTMAESEMVATVTKNFKNVVVVMNVGGMVDTNWFVDNVNIQSVLMAWQGGIEGGLAAAEILVGKGYPSGKLVDTFAKELSDYPSSYNFHESEKYVDYTEDIYVGYRYFESMEVAKKQVNYCFGFGLSYTDFAIETGACFEKENKIFIPVTVKNIGEVPGKEVVQVYFSAPQGKLGKPAKQLIAFRKTKELSPAQTEDFLISISVEDMASYDDLGKIAKAAYVLEAGEYSFFVGNSVRDGKTLDFIHVENENRVTLQLTSQMVPTSLEKRMIGDGSYESLPQLEPVVTDESVLTPMTPEESEGYSPLVRERARFHLWRQEGKPRQFIEVFEGKLSLDDFMEQLSDEDLMELLGGQPSTGVSNTFGWGNLLDYGVPNVMTADGPAGVRIAKEVGVTTTAFPCSTMLACTWNEEMVYAVGAAGGQELKENNLSCWLTPAINIHRSPLCGRNFEYYSEDPLVAGKLAGAMVRGIQSNGVSSCVKHFALNNKETNRKNSDSRCSERAIREIYLKAFEIVVKEAKPWSIMSSYNIINGRRASENKDMLTNILRDEWGFDGVVTTDWWTNGEHYKEILAGNDIKMATGYPERLKEAVKLGVLTRKDLLVSAKRVLEFLLKIE